MKTAKDTRDAVNRVCCDLDRQVSEFAAKVAPLFQANGWTWGKDNTPSVFDIESTLVFLINEVARGGIPTAASTGRLQVRVAQYDKRIVGNLELVPEYKMSETVHLD